MGINTLAPTRSTQTTMEKVMLKQFIRDDQGQDLIEYVLLGSFIAIVALAGATALGTNLNNWYTKMAGWAGTAASSVPSGS